jgi:hypothetical protein
MALLGEKTPIIFVCPPRPGARGEREAAILTPRQTELLGGTPLIVTEIIYSGEAVGSIVRALNRVGRVPDIASMSGFLTASEPYGPVLETSPVGRRPRGEFGKIVMSSSLSYAAQDLLTTDKVYAGVIREDISSTRVRPVRSMTDNPEVALEVNAFRGEIYRLAARLAALRASD